MEKKEKIIVTGCAGFIGSHLSERLLKENFTIIGIDNLNDYYDPSIKVNNLSILKKYSNFTFLEEDIITTKAILDHQPDYVVNLAAMAGVRKSFEAPALYFRVNVEGLVNLLETSIKAKVKKFVNASSSSVYGDSAKAPYSEDEDLKGYQVSPYASSKYTSEILCEFYSRVHSIPTVSLRFFTVYGPRGRPDMFPYICLKSVIKGEKIKKYGDGSSIRDYTYVDDIVDGIILSLFSEKANNQVFNLGNNKPHSLNEFIACIEKVTGKKLMYDQYDYQKGDVLQTHANVEKAHNMLNYSPKIDLETGIRRTYEWMMKELNQY